MLNVQVLGTFKQIVETSSRRKEKLSMLLSVIIQVKIRGFWLIALHVDFEESQSSDEEELKEAYGILYIKSTKLRETNKNNVMKLNTMKIQKVHYFRRSQTWKIN